MLKNKAVNDIGNKFEEAYLSKEFQEAPSDETIAKWIAIAELRREERRRRNRKLVSLASILLICICVGVTCTIKHPRAVAGSSGGNRVESGMETIKTYSSINEFPEFIQKNFIIFPDTVLDFQFNESIYEKNTDVEKLTFLYVNSSNEEIYISEIIGNNTDYLFQQVDNKYDIEQWNGLEVYISKYNNDESKCVYSFMSNHIFVTVNTYKNVSEDLIRTLVEKAV